MTPFAACDEGVYIRVKAVPGSSRDGVAGVLGDRIKIRVSAPAEGGKANAAICRVVAGALGLKASQVEIVTGHGHAEKTLLARGVSVSAARAALGA